MAKSLFDFDYLTQWPDPNKFPVNDYTQDYQVKNQIVTDIKNSEEYLIITGFTSIANLVDFFGSNDFQNLRKVKIAIGFEPDERISKRLPHVSLPTEIKNYWLRQNVSIRLCSPIVNIIEKINSGRIEFRVMNKLHAKLYVGQSHAVLGSSNFSKSGLTTQREANIRVQKLGEELSQYEGIKSLAEIYYRQSGDYNDSIIELLGRLLKDATWQEALARAIKEILEADWMREYPELYKALISTELWPSQRIGIARAMKIIQDQGRVLIADPTGSGKTKFSTALAYTVFHWLWENGQRDHSNALIISPKQVVDNWEREQSKFKLFNSIRSMGILSIGSEKNQQQLLKDIEKASILVIDEAHNYLNPASRRSRSITPKGSTNVILSTATPINKRPEDLLRLVEILDVDNLSDTDLKEFIELRKSKFKQIDRAKLKKLRTYINQFIVRRTKKQLNKMIEREPDQYKNVNNHLCKFPKTTPETYETGENEIDKKLALDIRNLTEKLKGVNNLQTIVSPFYLTTDEEKLKFLHQRLKSAPALAAFTIKSSLRSSHCALMEHLVGSEKAMKYFKVSSSKFESGNIIGKLEKCKSKQPHIEDQLKKWIPKEYVWLLDKTEYSNACDEEKEIYTQILELVKKLTGSREKAKAQYLANKAQEFGKILAFDSTVITLDYLDKLITEISADINIMVATGQSESAKNQVKELYGHGDKSNQPTIALCSDAMAEGINLPNARALVLLDMPSVLRKIEQRIGRLERMDSEHKEIFIYWPNDSDEFSLKGDKKIFDILVMAESLIGNNVDVPQALYDKHLKSDLSVQNYMKAYEELSKQEEDFEWEGVRDSTEYIYGLIDGEKSIIDVATYKQLKDVDASVKSKISFIETTAKWSFFAFRGDSSKSAKWLLIDKAGKAHTDFVEISLKLQEYLGNPKTIVQKRWNDVDTSGEIKKLTRMLQRREKDLLSWKKRRALEIGQKLLKHFYNDSTKKKKDKKAIIGRLLSLYEPNEDGDDILDLDHFADLWLKILLPALDKKRQYFGYRRRLITLHDLTHHDVYLSKRKLIELYESCRYANTLDELIAACIIAVPNTKS